MIKIAKKIILVLLIYMLCFSTINVIISGATSGVTAEDLNKFKGSTSDIAGSGAATSILSSILSIVRTIGAGVAVVILMIIGAKYLVASAGDRADIKKYAINYVIGAIILFAASGILSIVKGFVDSSFVS